MTFEEFIKQFTGTFVDLVPPNVMIQINDMIDNGTYEMTPEIEAWIKDNYRNLKFQGLIPERSTFFGDKNG